MELTRLTSPVVIDGAPNDAAWRDIPTLPLTMYLPVFRGTPTQRTEIRVAYDDENFYAAGWFYDTEPDKIRINSLYRDRWAGDDALAIYIDAYNDNQTSKWFGTTPAGIRFELLVSDDGSTLNGNWDTFWTANTTVTDSGWFAEVKIPFSSLGFQADDEGKVVMGLTVTRLVSRIEERVTFPAIDPKFEFRRPSVAQDVVLRGVRSHKPLYVTGYGLTGMGRTSVPLTGGAFGTDREASGEVGADLRYPLSGDLTLDLTVNTDFAQVEADDQQVNLDRFPLFFPERRRFFQEGSNVFDFTSPNNTRLFHSRRIGLTPDGTPVPVLGGARLVGRAGPWDVGVLEMQTGDQGPIEGANFGVLRLRRPVVNPFSTIGAMATSYLGADRQNFALGVDGTLRTLGDHYLTVKWAGTTDRPDSTGVPSASGQLIDTRWERRTARGLAYSLAYTRAGENYRPELGFMPRQDFTTANFLANWYFFTNGSRTFRRVWPGALAFSTFRNADNVLESGQYAFWVQWETKAGAGGWIEPKWFRENVVRAFPIGGRITIPAGSYDFADLQIYYAMPAGATLRTSVDFRAGTYFDGRRTQVIVTPTWNASKHLELGADYQLSALRFARRQQEENIHVARLRVRAAMDARMSGNAFIQYNSTTGRLDGNVRLRYAFAEGTDLWLVYNEGLDTDRARDPQGVLSPRWLARTLILKYTHTLAF
jgi:hypothetical protein